MNANKRINCTYSEFINLITKIKEDTFFEITGSFEPLSEEQLNNLYLPEEKREQYYDSNMDFFDDLVLLLSAVKDGIKVELDLRNYDDFIYDNFVFNNISSLKGIILPERISWIYAGAFQECENLEYVIIPKGQCKGINEYAFNDCPKLQKLLIEGELETVEQFAVCECNKLKHVDYSPEKKDSGYYYLNPAEFDVEKLCIETERLLVKPLLQKDFDSIKTYFYDPRILKYEERREIGNYEILKEKLEGSEENWKEQEFRNLYFKICLKESEENIGFVPFLRSSPRLEDEEVFKDQTGYMIGWDLAFEHHNKGYATEAARAVVEWAKSFLKVKRIWAFAVKENKASIHVMEKLGMKFEKEFTVVEKDGQKRVKVIYALLS